MIDSCPTRRILAFRKSPLAVTLPSGDLTTLPLGLHAEVRDAAYRYLATRPAVIVLRGTRDELGVKLADAMQGTFDALREDIMSLVSLYADMTGHSVMRVRLERIVTDSCRKFHVDHLALRLLRSYVGPGVQWTRDDGAHIEDTPPGAVVLLAGTAHPDWSDQCTVRHRSPPMTAAQLQVGGRLLLTIDETVLGHEGLIDACCEEDHDIADRGLTPQDGYAPDDDAGLHVRH
ncbi:DUF1826 domain-containing protein [Asaia bogorensis]|uniref:DUF1826 domain-containing protein n=1 Tax=Asaia bogorensis TaxID=91915 RepID=UPI000EFBCC63|nr:DUF1826 domain-containing protein [Asaia bogorensis]